MPRNESVSTRTTGDGKPFHEQLDELRSITEETLRYAKTIHQFTPKDGPERSAELRQLLEDNLNYSKACYALLERWRRWLLWSRVWGVVKLVLIIVPLILGIIYLPPFLQQWTQQFVAQYQKMLVPPGR